MTLQHGTLEIRREDEAAEIAFWALLGFEQVPVPDGLRGVAAWVASNGTHIHLLYDDAPTVAPRGHVAVLAGDEYEAMIARLGDAGFAFRPDAELWGVPRGFVKTPSGHRVEIMSGPPPP
jgi:catechol 2,3-dioxygenase-like lactoylglutathione lyase family enzyme